MLYYGRTGYVAIENEAGKMVSYGGDNALDFRFSGEKVGNVYSKFNVGVLGLTLKTINQLTVWNPAKAYSRKRKISVYAGYANGGIKNPIFTGFVLEAIPTNPPEMWLNFQCLNAAAGNADAYAGTGETVSEEKEVEGAVVDIFKAVATELGFGTSYDWRAEKVSYDTKGAFVIKGRKTNLADLFADQFGVNVYVEGGVLVANDRRPWLGTPDSPVKVSTATGMIGIANLTAYGVTVKKRLDDTIGFNGWIELESSVIPSANGKFIVTKKRHTGHLRGNDWFTELECIRQGANT